MTIYATELKALIEAHGQQIPFSAMGAFPPSADEPGFGVGCEVRVRESAVGNYAGILAQEELAHGKVIQVVGSAALVAFNGDGIYLKVMRKDLEVVVADGS